MREGSILSNVRVLEVGEGRVGPWAGALLADLGAEVIKVESITRPDMTRGTVGLSMSVSSFHPEYPDGKPGERHWNRNCQFTARNIGKVDVTLDLAKPEGLLVFFRLVKVCDIFLSNMAVGAAERLGIAYEELFKVKPEIIYLSSTGYGRTGPYAQRVAMGATIDAAAGLFGLRDYGDGDSTAVSPDTHCDSIAALTNAFAMLMALYYRNRTGKGMYIDASMVEPSISHIGEAIMDYSMNHRILRSLGNRDKAMAPQGCYRCQGEDEWVTFTIRSDEEWQRLTGVINNPQLAQDARFADVLERLKHQDELDREIEAWTIQHSKFEVMELLQQAGIAAGAILNSADVYNDPHVRERGFIEVIDHPDAGVHKYAGRLWKFRETKLPNRRHAPCLGEDNDYVLRQLAGLTPDEVAALEKQHIIGTAPVEVV